jgi:hypothetical protein
MDTSKASIQTHVPADLLSIVPVAAIVRVCAALARLLIEYCTFCAA